MLGAIRQVFLSYKVAACHCNVSSIRILCTEGAAILPLSLPADFYRDPAEPCLMSADCATSMIARGNPILIKRRTGAEI